jgi:hypothetical protein
VHQGRACVGCVLSRARRRQLKKKQTDGLVEGACACVRVAAGGRSRDMK